MSKILVTGGAGFVGSNLVDRLLKEGNEVVIIDDLSSGKKEYLNPQAKFYHLDICSKEIASVFVTEKFDYVYHLAAQIDVRKSVADPIYDNQINVVGALNILENSRKNKIKKIIFASSGGAVYGEAEEIPSTEHCPTYPLSPYGINKLSFEKYLHYYYQTYKLDYTSLRFANIYGPRQFKGGEAGVIAIFIANAVRNQESVMYGDGRQTRDFVYVDDVVEALYLSKDIDCRGEINIGSGIETNLIQLQEKIEQALKQKINIRKDFPKKGEQLRSVLSAKRAQVVLNWSPKVDLAEGIKRTINWTQKNQ